MLLFVFIKDLNYFVVTCDLGKNKIHSVNLINKMEQRVILGINLASRKYSSDSGLIQTAGFTRNHSSCVLARVIIGF